MPVLSNRVKRFAVDADGVMYDLLGGMIAHLKARWKYDLKREDVKQYSLAGLTGVPEIDEDIIRQLRTPRFFFGLAPSEGAQEAIRMLADSGIVYVVTARGDHCSSATHAAVSRDFPDAVSEVVHTPNKARYARSMRIKYAVDDGPHLVRAYVDARIKTWMITSGYTAPGDIPHSRRFLRTAPSLLAAARDILKSSSNSVEEET